MTRFATRIGAIALTLGALVLTPAIGLANDYDPGAAGQHDNAAIERQVPVKDQSSYRGEGLPRIDNTVDDDTARFAAVDRGRSYLGEGLPRVNVERDHAGYAQVEPDDLMTLIAERVARGELTVQALRYLEANVWDYDELRAYPAGEPDAVFEEIKQLFGTEHVTQDMIEFYEANFWLPGDYALPAGDDGDLLPGPDGKTDIPAGQADW